MPETEKVIRIAQLFGVSLDTLLMGKEEKPEPEPQPQPQYQQPRHQSSGISGDRVERFIRRHGYKAGYAMMAAGAGLCVISLLLYLVWPAIGNAFFGSFTDSFSDPFNMMGGYEFRIEGDIPAGMEDMILDELYGSGYGSTAGGLWDSGMSSMQSAMNGAMRAQATLFLLPMIPGLILTGAGLFIVIKGKKIAGQVHT